ncbi:nuclear receptor-binding protein [Grus japonensis]|uniref:Nuclear receptor-binding protein n=1 Tax=Grus japonensis TaxID=30415 RepID=A0ABC9WIV3_GRUJA
MSEGESKQVPSSGSDSKPESASSGPGMTSVSASVTSAAPPEEEEEEEEESEDESEILEESPCGRWQKRREELQAMPLGLSLPALGTSPSPAFLEPLQGLEGALRSPRSLLFSRLNQPNSLSLRSP